MSVNNFRPQGIAELMIIYTIRFVALEIVRIIVAGSRNGPCDRSRLIHGRKQARDVELFCDESAIIC